MLDRLTIERMMAWTGDKPVLVALSGGGDSVALLHLLTAELGAAWLRAVVVDHALRDGSKDDAERAAGFAAALGVRADILTLSWEEGGNRAQQAAREARYKAICEHARAESLNTIVAAHTADDQAETVLMRAANGSTWRGLAGMAPFAFAPVWPEGRGIALARPLLGARRDALRAYLSGQRADWIEDPANANPKFARVRVRQRLAELEMDGFEPMRLVTLAARLRLRSDLVDRDAKELVERTTAFEGEKIIIRLENWCAPIEVRCRALGALMAAVTGMNREPSPAKLLKIVRRITSPEHRGSTHSHVQFIPRRDGILELRREPGRGAEGPREPLIVVLEPGIETIWDKRFVALASEPGWRIRREGERPSIDRRRPVLPWTVRPSLRFLAAERIAHAFAPDINRAKP